MPSRKKGIQVRLWAVVGRETGDGIWATFAPGGWIPLVALDKTKVLAFRSIADRIALSTGKTYDLVEFHDEGDCPRGVRR